MSTLAQGNMKGKSYWIYCKDGKYYLKTFQRIREIEAEAIMTEARKEIFVPKAPKVELTASDILRLVEIDNECEEKRRKEIRQWHLEEFYGGNL